MGYEETRTYAAERIIDSLCSGKNFNGLGSEAHYLVQATAVNAYANAQLIHRFDIPNDGYWTLLEKCKREFVADIIGFGQYVDERGVVIKGPMTPQRAAIKLVDTVWEEYINWAVAAQTAAQ